MSRYEPRRDTAREDHTNNGKYEGVTHWQYMSLDDTENNYGTRRIERTKGMLEAMGRNDVLTEDGSPEDLEGTVFKAKLTRTVRDTGEFVDIRNVVAVSHEDADEATTEEPEEKPPARRAATRRSRGSRSR